MRDAFHDELDAITASLVEMGELVSLAMREGTTALLTTDLKLAEKVIADDDRIDDMQHELEANAIGIMARQQPVAQDLRTLVTSLRMSADLERMGDFGHHIAKIARMRYPAAAVPGFRRVAGCHQPGVGSGSGGRIRHRRWCACNTGTGPKGRAATGRFRESGP